MLRLDDGIVLGKALGAEDSAAGGTKQGSSGLEDGVVSRPKDGIVHGVEDGIVLRPEQGNVLRKDRGAEDGKEGGATVTSANEAETDAVASMGGLREGERITRFFGLKDRTTSLPSRK